MIRRQVGDKRQVSQAVHARLAADLVDRFGNDAVTPPPDRTAVRLAALHHEDGLRVTPAPGDSLATRLAIDVASVTRTAAVDPYAGLLVSIHVTQPPPDRPLPESATLEPDDRLRLASFLADEAERRDELRIACGLGTDLATDDGLAVGDAADRPAEKRLAADFMLLRFVDLLSLTLCRGRPVRSRLPLPIYDDRPRNAAILRPMGQDVFEVEPWPFDRDGLGFDVAGVACSLRRPGVR
jgi:hypothetical protein